MLLEKKYNFVYITTNLINGHQYIGEHSSNDLNCYKTINYIGSGRPYFDRAKKKYGRRNFKRVDFAFAQNAHWQHRRLYRRPFQKTVRICQSR